MQPRGEFLVTVVQSNTPDRSEVAPVFYRLSPKFQVVDAEVGDTYRQYHAQLELAGSIKHRFGGRDERELFPVLSWDGQKFLKVGRQGKRLKTEG